jgi:WD40 repeat protein
MPEIGAVGQEPFALQETEIRSVAFSPNGLRLASAGRGGIVWCWDLATCRGTQLPSGEAGHVRSLAFSPDASTLASACADRVVQLRSVPFGEMTGTLEGHEGGVYTVAYSPDGRMIASGGDDGTIKLWNSIDQTPIATLHGHDSTVRAVAFRPDGRRLASGGDDSIIRLWSLVDHKSIGTLSRHDSEVRSVAFSPDGRRLASGGRDGSVLLWDPVKFTQLELLAQHEGWVFSVAFSPDEHSLACGCSDGTVWLYDLTKSNSSDTPRLKLVGHDGQVRSVAFSPDGQVLASGGDDRSVRLWEVSTGKQLVRHHPGPPLKQIPHHGVAVEDAPTAVDWLGFRHDVNALAAIIAAKGTTPPISIAVTGCWGIGKTSFAKQLENTLDRLVAGVDDTSEGTFVSSVCHVSFNAWHYSDEHIWVGIIDNLFQALSAYCAPRDSGQNARPREVVERIEKLTIELDEYRQEMQRIEQRRRILGFVEDSDTYSDQAQHDEQGEQEDRERGVTADLNKRRFRNLWQAVRDTIQLRWRWLAAGILSATAGASIAWAAHTAYGLLASLPLAGTIIAAVHTFAVKHRGMHDKWKTELDNEAARKKGEIERIERQLTLLEPVRALSNFLRQRAHAEAYGAHRGVMGMVHRDITELHEISGDGV